MADISNVTSREPTQLEGLAIEGEITLNKLINTVEEIFNTLVTYTLDEKNFQQKVIESRNKYKIVADELNNIIGKIDEKQLTENKMEITEAETDPAIKELIETRDGLLEESELQKNHLTRLLDQTYDLQFLIQTLLASSEQQEVVPDA